MDVREKLVELIESAENQRLAVSLCCTVSELIDIPRKEEYIADHLIANGVTVQKHGRWLLDGRCSECLENPLTTHKTYCPSCGAKMDLER